MAAAGALERALAECLAAAPLVPVPVTVGATPAEVALVAWPAAADHPLRRLLNPAPDRLVFVVAAGALPSESTAVPNHGCIRLFSNHVRP
jgi:hypothetical protein